MKVFCVVVVLLGTSTALLASAVPEIDASTGSSALALLIGGLVVIRARRQK
jgi:hypothetical protein